MNGLDLNKMESKRSWYDKSFTLCIFGMLQALIVLPISVIAYGGGHADNPTSPGFSMLYNFFSDLGRLTAYSGTPNLVSSILFNTSLFFTGVLMIPYFIAFPKIFQGTREPLLFSVLGSIIGVFFASTFIGAAFTPSDIFREIHLMFGALAFVSGLPIVVFHIFAILTSDRFPNRYSLVYLVLGVVLSLFLYAMLQTGPSELSLAVTIGQKFVVVTIMVCFLIQALASRNIVRASEV
jgi:hypothetical membrane protein